MSLAPWRRHLVCACLCAGLALSPLRSLPAGSGLALAGAAVALGFAAARLRPAAAPLALAACLLACLSGLYIGNARLVAIDGQGLAMGEGERVQVRGFVVTAPKQIADATRFAVETGQGRVGLALDRPDDRLAVGERVGAEGRLRPVEPWLADLARRNGWRLELETSAVRVIPGGRSGLNGYLDRARARAESGLTAGLDPDQNALARGFVLGQDEAVDPLVRDDFRRSGLAHLLSC